MAEFIFDDCFLLRAPILPSELLGQTGDIVFALERLIEKGSCGGTGQRQKHIRLLAIAILIANPKLFFNIANSSQHDEYFQPIANYLRRACERSTPRGLFATVSFIEPSPKTESDWTISSNLFLGGFVEAVVFNQVNAELSTNREAKLGINATLIDRGKYLEIFEYSGAISNLTEVRKKVTVGFLEKEIIELFRRGANRQTAVLKLALLGHNKRKVEAAIDILIERNIVQCGDFPLPTHLSLVDLLKQIHVTNYANKTIGTYVADLEGYASDLAKFQDNLLEDTSLGKLIGLHQKLEASIVQDGDDFGKMCLVDCIAERPGIRPNIVESSTRAIERCMFGLTRSFLTNDPHYAAIHKKIFSRFGETIIPFQQALEATQNLEISPPTSEKLSSHLRGLMGESHFQEKSIDVSYFVNDNMRTNSLGVSGAFQFLPVFSGATLPPTQPVAQMTGYRLGTGGEFLGRISTRLPKMQEHVRKISERAFPLGCTPVELFFTPSLRYRSVTARPRVAERYICLNSSDSASSGNAISLTDLLIVCTETGLELVQKSTGEVLQIVLNTAHDWMHDSQIHIYRFLGAMAHRHSIGTLFPHSQANRNHAPELVLEKCIISPERWWLSSEDRHRFSKLGRDQRRNEMERLVEMRDYAKHVFVGAGDTKVACNLSHNEDLVRFTRELLREGSIVERRYPHLGSVVDQKMGETYSNCEIVKTFSDGKRKLSIQPNHAKVAASKCYEQKEPVIGRVLFFKLYGKEDRLIEYLVDVVEPFMKQLTKKSLIGGWFFIRYSDPEFHLRIRLLTSSEEFRQPCFLMMNEVFEEALQTGEIADWNISRYQPERFRYGGLADFSLVEELFCIDSNNALDLIRCQVENDLEKHEVASLLAEQITHLSALFENNQERLIANIRSHLTSLKSAIGAHKNWDILANTAGRDNLVDLLPYNHFQERVGSLIGIIKSVEEDIGLTTSLWSIFLSLAHMKMNRVFHEWGREWEYVVYSMVNSKLSKKKRK